MRRFLSIAAISCLAALSSRACAPGGEQTYAPSGAVTEDNSPSETPTQARDLGLHCGFVDNLGFESGTLDGWYSGSGIPVVTTETPPGPAEGKFYLVGGDASAAGSVPSMFQELTVDRMVSLARFRDAVTSGRAVLHGAYSGITLADEEPTFMMLSFCRQDSQCPQTILLPNSTEPTWTSHERTAPIPDTTASVLVRLGMVWMEGETGDAAWDAVELCVEILP